MKKIKLTPYQLMFYYEWRVNPLRTDYNLVADNTLTGNIDEQRFMDCFKKVFNEHFIFRHNIIDQSPDICWTLRPLALASDIITYYDHPLSDEEMRNLTLQPFDLEKDLLGRVHLFKLAENQYRFILIIHHIAVDGISVEELWSKLRSYYNGENYSLQSFDLQIENHQKLNTAFEKILTEQKSTMVAFWQDHLRGTKNIDLTFLKSQQLSQPESKRVITEYLFSYDEQVVQQVKSLRRQYKITTYLFGQLVMGLLLHKMVNQSDIPLAYPVAILEGKELIYGAHVNVLPINYHFDDKTTLQSTIDHILAYHRGVKKTNAKYLPIYDIISTLNNPNILDVAFVQTFLRDHTSQFNGLYDEQTNHDLQVDLSNILVVEQEEYNNHINYRIKFNETVLDKQLVKQFVMLYQKLFMTTLDYLLDGKADILTKNINILDDNAKQELIVAKNQTHVPYAKNQTVIELFEQQVLNTPQNIAVIFEQTTLTYQELNLRVNQLAHYLRQHLQIKANDFIGLYLDRSQLSIMSILAILKAGAAYVPMDPDAPDERNAYIMQDAKVKAVICQAHYSEKLAKLTTDVPLFAVDCKDLIASLDDYSNENLISLTAANDLAYSIYTSGTTGKPKGTLIELHNINRLVINTNFVTITPEDRLLSISGYHFDASTYDIFGSLLNGAAVVIATKDKFLNLSYFNQLIADNQVSNFFVTTAFFNSLVDADLPNLGKLKYILTGGESLSAVHVNKFLTNYPQVKLLNVYGPTETTTFATAFLTNQVDQPFAHNVPIGKPINNTSLYILDQLQQLVPKGVIGELYIGGAGVGRGYLNNRELTNKTFINNPFQTDVEKAEGYNDRLYKTGDLVRYLADDNIEYIGRNDFQIKIRGFRVELTEIENRLILHPDIKQAIVIAVEHSPNNKFLAAYYVADTAIASQVIIDYLQQFLPDYMLPSALVHLTAFPLNINGKVDRKALPVATLNHQGEYIAPSTQTESLLVDVYAEFLLYPADKISVTDDFFKLGGNSILAIKLASKLAKLLNKKIHVADILAKRTVQKLAQFIDNNLEQVLVITAPKVNHCEEQLLSYAQERLWFIHCYEGESSAYNVPLVFKITDGIKLNGLELALQRIISRHEILHSIIKTNEDGLGYQQVIDLGKSPIVIEHVICKSKQQLDNYLYKHTHYLFKLDKEPAISIKCYQLGEQHYISIIIHHIAFDGWSTDLFIKELLHYYWQYHQVLAGDINEIEELFAVDVQYKDFALWQRQYLQSDVLDEQLSYWQQQLANYTILNLPTDYTRPSQIDYQGHDIQFQLNESLSLALRQLATELNVSLYTVLLSGYYLLLNSFSHQNDIVVGTPTAGRHYPGIENTMGFFVNNLVLRRQLDHKTPLADFIKQTGELVANAQKYQDIPFEKLVEAVQIDKDTSRHPIFQVMFGVQSFANVDDHELNRLITLYETEQTHYEAAKFDITTLLDDSQKTIKGSFNYATSLFNENTIKQYINVYLNILGQFVDICQQQKSLAHVAFLNSDAVKTLLYDKNQTYVPYAKDRTVTELFEQQVSTTPNNTAVIFEQTELSYFELNHRVNQLAHYLRQHAQINANDFIALYLDRSELSIISILAILKAGAAYVPMDPDAPQERNTYIMQDANVKAVITQAHYLEKLTQLAINAPIIAVDSSDLTRSLSDYSSDNLVSQTTPDDLAYCIYTSGTTGKPKGTLIELHNINRLIINTHFVKITPEDRLLSISGYHFDASIYDIFGSLLNGAAIVIATKDKFLNLEYFNQLIADKKITNFFATTAFFNTLVDARLPNLGLLKYIIAGGEALSAVHVNQFLQHYPQVKFLNAYGPTETTTFATTFLANQASQPFEHSVPIGRPISNTSLYVLDDLQRPVPFGAIGELYIGGAGVGRGYLNNCELTAKVFINNPFQTEAEKAQGYNDRLYKTGDLVRYLADDNIEYIGRNDLQIKIRGFRVELSEIENRLILHPQIKQATVVALDHGTNNKLLAAYYVADNALLSQDILDYLQQFLPDYMLPSALVHLTALPLNINGKVDRRALPLPQLNHSTIYVAPTNDTEQLFCQTFASILRLDASEISIDDDFFKLGGDSISSIQLANRIRQTLNYYLSIKDIFNYRTIKALSDYVINNQKASKISIKTDQGILDGSIELAPIQQWFFSNVASGKLPDYGHWNQAFLIKVPPLNIGLLKLSLAKLVEQHDMLRACYPSLSKGYYSSPTDVAFDHCNINNWSESDISSQLTTWQNRFDINNCPLYHFGYLEGYQDNSARIHVAVHHLNIDAVSWRIIMQDLQTIYQFFLQQDNLDPSVGVAKILGNKVTSYRQWVENGQNYPVVNQQTGIDEREYWHQVLTDFTGYQQHINQCRSKALANTQMQLSKAHTDLLLRKVNIVYHTDINDILLTALAHSLSLMFKQSEHYILLEGHGREALFNDIDINNTVGWFTCMYPVKLVANLPSKLNNLVCIKDNLRAIPNNGMGYGQLMGYIKHPLPAISFNYLGQFNSEQQALWSFSHENAGIAMSANNNNTDFLSLNGGVIDEQLQFTIAGYLLPEQLAAFSTLYTQQLEALIDELSKTERSYLTSSDINYLISPSLLGKLQANDEIEAICPTNSLQQGFIYHAVAQGDLDSAYRVQMIWEYHNPLQVDLLRQAWQITQAQLPSLRLRFNWDEELVQVIDKKGDFSWQFLDLSSDSKDQQLTKIDQISQQDQQISYDLAKGQLFRLYLVKLNQTHYQCIFSNHHAILDGWSVPVLLKAVHQNYLSLANSEPLVTFDDNCYLNAQHFLQQNLKATADFWQSYLPNDIEPENLTSLVKPAMRHVNLSDHRYVSDPQELILCFDTQSATQLKELCKAHDFTINALMQYCWHQQLNLYGNSDTTVIGMTVSGRNLPIDGIETSVGLYINTLPVILNHTDDSVINKVKELQSHINNVNNHANASLIKLQNTGIRLFNSLFVFENYPTSALDTNELKFVFKEGKEKLDYPLGLVAFENSEQIELKLKYAGELFEAQTIARLLTGIKLTIEQLICDPTILVKELKLLTDVEYQQRVIAQSEQTLPFVNDKLLTQIFEEQVQRTPNTVAAVYRDVALTYQALNNQANQLANYLSANLDLQPDDFIALYLDKSEHMLISMLATLKAGAAYVPISPQVPAERTELMVKDSQAKAILCHSHYQASLNALFAGRVQVIAIDDNSLLATVAEFDQHNLVTSTKANNLAYIIYTSGTTGKPKGAMIEHHSLVNIAINQLETLSLPICYNSHDAKRVLWYANYAFDAHVLEVYCALLNGHTVYILPEEQRFDFGFLASYIKDQHIDFTFMTPALLDKNDLLPLPILGIGGEAANNELVNRYCEQGTRLINIYGPTETTVWATAHIYQKNDMSTNLGHALNNYSLYVLDNYLRPVPTGVIGELYIGGEGVGRGYLNNAELTSKVFITNPFQTTAEQAKNYNARLYKTGDLVRYLENGDLEYISRNDSQVKIRGFRIELGEIESRLVAYPSISQALVLALNNSAGNKYLAAYYVADKPTAHEQIVSYLAQFLPEYMVPATFIHLTALPVNINGKVDRKLLPAPTLLIENDYIAPSNDIEQFIVAAFADLLSMDVTDVSIKNDFFRLGGNSILAIKLSNKIVKQFNKKIHVSDIFAKRTAKAIAQLIEASGETQQHFLIPKIESPEQQLLSFAQERLWFIDSYEGGSNAYNIPLVFKLASQIDIHRFIDVLKQIITRHEILRTVIKTNRDGIGYQQVVNIDEYPLPIEQIVCSDKSALDSHIYRHVHKIFLLDKELPISINIYQLADNHYISMVIHHIAFDGWSTDLLIKEMVYACENMVIGKKIELPEITLQYKDFALWQRHYLQDEVLSAQLQYWLNQLEHYEPLNLPSDYVRPVQTDYIGADINFELGKELSANLRSLANELGVSLYSVLLSGYYLALHAFSQQNDIVIGTPIAGRHYAGVENTMGFFVNMLAIRKLIKGDETLTQFIEQTSESIFQAQKYQDLPFEKLVDAMRIEKDHSRHPIFQVMFGVQSFGSAIGLSDKTYFTPYQTQDTQYKIAKFDITTLLNDSADSIHGSFNYATSLFSEQTINHYIQVYRYILSQFTDLYHQQQTIADLAFLDESTYQKIVYQWNKTRCDYPKNTTIHALFEEQVTRTPNNLALIYENERLTYQALNEKANQLAHYLRDNFAIKPDDLVALCLDRSQYMLISILAIIKAGGAYVPMDPQAPSDRIGYMIGDTKAKAILTTSSSYNKVSMLASEQQVVVNLQADNMVSLLNRYPKTNPAPLAKPNNLAYVIYTSGTTGNPKGVMLEHQGAVNRIIWMHNEYPITQQDHILQKTNYTFDVSVWELFWANWYGACIVFAHSERYKDNVYLAELIEAEQITVLHFVPSMLVAFVETLQAQPMLQSKVQKLKYLFCSGEALNLYEVQQCQKLMPNCQIHNLYGPTEATVDVLYYDCNNPNIKQVLIGKPIANTSAYVLNERLQPVPIGGLGELYIGGDNVGRGYLNNPVLSAEKFITNPFQSEQEKQQNYNGRIYKTGDVVRYLGDGNIQYLGRNDFQVKIRGFRIELGEIDARLTLYPDINHSVVIAYEQATGSKYLVAYYVAQQPIDSHLLHNHLKETLPSYMIPTAFIYLTDLPITSNGKLNRKVLPKPELTDNVEYIAASNPIEVTLCDIFAATLKITASNISMMDNFFKLGGNSILAMMLNNRINEAFQIKLRLVDVLSSETIKELATKIADQKQSFNPIVPLNKAVNKPQMFMIHPGIGGCDVYASLANKLSERYHCYGVDSYNFYHDDKIANLAQLTKYYLNYVEQVRVKDQPISLLGWSLGGHIALEMAGYLETQGYNNITVYLLDTWLLNQADLAANIHLIDLNHAMKELNIPASLQRQVEDIVAVDNLLTVQPLSTVLNATKVTLFKAIKAQQSISEQYIKYPYNNIDSYLAAKAQLTVIEIDCDHYQIIKHERELIRCIV
ncbi:amino acid adenylation domain-containing protein [Orbus wheelerorum]|uniref:non-ribosomal peptide synthetase n=1 Tax=Orbus wheelerorum TaxID=3074111 RepID=UPI00370DB945